MAFADDLNIDLATLGLTHDCFQPPLMRRAHRHNEIELNFLESGSMMYLFGGTRTIIKTGQLALFWAAVPHQLIQVEASTLMHLITIPFASFLQWQLPDILTRQIVCGKFVLDPEERYRQTTLLQLKQWHDDLHHGSPELRTIALLELEARLRRLALSLPPESERSPSEASTNSTSVHEVSKVEQMAAFIAAHYCEPIHVDQVAAAAHLHSGYAMTLFRKSFGLSILDYITQHRLAHAQRLLIMTSITASAIALEAGFGSVSQFYSAFKATCGMSPRAYRTTFRL